MPIGAVWENQQNDTQTSREGIKKIPIIRRLF